MPWAVSAAHRATIRLFAQSPRAAGCSGLRPSGAFSRARRGYTLEQIVKNLSGTSPATHARLQIVNTYYEARVRDFWQGGHRRPGVWGSFFYAGRFKRRERKICGEQGEKARACVRQIVSHEAALKGRYLGAF